VYDSSPSSIQSLAYLFGSVDNNVTVTANFSNAVNFNEVVFPYDFAVAGIFYYGK